MKTKNLLLLILFVIFVVLILACGQEAKENKIKKPASEPMFRTEETKAEKVDNSIASLAVLARGGTLMAEKDSAGSKENREGIGHYKEGHWAESEKYFRKALAVNDSLAEAHYNLALALDKQENHGDATEHFKKALELAPDNRKIKDSKILNDHVGAGN